MIFRKYVRLGFSAIGLLVPAYARNKGWATFHKWAAKTVNFRIVNEQKKRSRRDQWPECFIAFFMGTMDPMSGFDICLFCLLYSLETVHCSKNIRTPLKKLAIHYNSLINANLRKKQKHLLKKTFTLTNSLKNGWTYPNPRMIGAGTTCNVYRICIYS